VKKIEDHSSSEMITCGIDITANSKLLASGLLNSTGPMAGLFRSANVMGAVRFSSDLKTSQ
jgi:hypothetical protein